MNPQERRALDSRPSLEEFGDDLPERIDKARDEYARCYSDLKDTLDRGEISVNEFLDQAGNMAESIRQDYNLPESTGFGED